MEDFKSKTISPRNYRVKTVRRLLNSKKFRKEKGLFLIEGIRLIEEAISAAYPIEFILFNEKLRLSADGIRIQRLLNQNDIPSYDVDEKTFKTLSETENSQGILGVAKIKEFNIEEIFLNEQHFILVVDGVQDPGNLGTLVRTSDAAGVDGIILTPNTVDIYNSKVVRASMGSIFHIPFITMSYDLTVETLKKHDVKIIVGDVSAQSLYYEAEFCGSTAIVVGNENRGPSGIFKHAGQCVRIPCRTESLNVAVAAAVLLYERVRTNK